MGCNSESGSLPYEIPCSSIDDQIKDLLKTVKSTEAMKLATPEDVPQSTGVAPVGMVPILDQSTWTNEDRFTEEFQVASAGTVAPPGRWIGALGCK